MEINQQQIFPVSTSLEKSQPNPFLDVVNEFEKSIKSFINMYNVEVSENRTNNDFGKKSQLNLIELNKRTIEQQTEEVYQKARNLERLFLTHRLEILKKKPDQLVKEEISCLKAELARKEELLNDTKFKIANFEQSFKVMDQQIKSRVEINQNGFCSNEVSNQGLTGSTNIPATPPISHFP